MRRETRIPDNEMLRAARLPAEVLSANADFQNEVLVRL